MLSSNSVNLLCFPFSTNNKCAFWHLRVYGFTEFAIYSWKMNSFEKLEVSFHCLCKILLFFRERSSVFGHWVHCGVWKQIIWVLLHCLLLQLQTSTISSMSNGCSKILQSFHYHIIIYQGKRAPKGNKKYKIFRNQFRSFQPLNFMMNVLRSSNSLIQLCLGLLLHIDVREQFTHIQTYHQSFSIFHLFLSIDEIVSIGISPGPGQD